MEVGKVKKVKKRIFAGAVLEQITFNVSDRVQNIAVAAPPKPRFKNDREREEHRAGVSKRHHARLFNENFAPSSLYSTLTFDNENEIHSFSEARQIRRNLIRALKRKYPDAVIFVYIGRGKSTHRIHFHMVSEGLPKEVISEKWKYGTVVRISQLRSRNYYENKDCGQDYTGLANYLWEHWSPEQGGHRWFMTRNAKKPECEPAEEIKRAYSPSKPPRAPKGYVLIEATQTPYGYCYFKYVKGEQSKATNRGRRPPPAG